MPRLPPSPPASVAALEPGCHGEKAGEVCGNTSRKRTTWMPETSQPSLDGPAAGWVQRGVLQRLGKTQMFSDGVHRGAHNRNITGLCCLFRCDTDLKKYRMNVETCSRRFEAWRVRTHGHTRMHSPQHALCSAGSSGTTPVPTPCRTLLPPLWGDSQSAALATPFPGFQRPASWGPRSLKH